MTHSATIVIIDDHDDSRAIYGAVLEHHGYAVLASASREEGAHLLATAGVRLACVALPPLPGGGLHTLEPLRRAAARGGIPLLAMGTDGAPDIGTRVRAAGCAGYVLKPCRPMELVIEIRRVLEGAVEAA